MNVTIWKEFDSPSTAADTPGSDLLLEETTSASGHPSASTLHLVEARRTRSRDPPSPESAIGNAVPAQEVTEPKVDFAQLMGPRPWSTRVNVNAGDTPAADLTEARWTEMHPEIRVALSLFDIDGTGVKAEVLRAAAAKWRHSQGEAGRFNLNAFPEDLHDHLRVFDPNNDGYIDKKELALAVKMYEREKRESRFLKIVVVLMVIALIILLAGSFVMSLAAVEVAKEMRADDGGIVTTTTGDVAAMGSAFESVDLFEYPYIPMDDLRHTTDFSFDHNGELFSFCVSKISKVASSEDEEDLDASDEGEDETEEEENDDPDEDVPGDVRITTTSGDKIDILLNRSLMFNGNLVLSDDEPVLFDDAPVLVSPPVQDPVASAAPTLALSRAPSILPTFAPSFPPSSSPSTAPTHLPSAAPTHLPSAAPTHLPSAAPTHLPSAAPTVSPVFVQPGAPP
eukprot:TRINITY_DN4402_c0_g1_i8.p1 TRINITY_DN4402_c0_g1~~TRINITY_DN4402_c0_g1_i8.p1  ORF type:complete len:466 (-),score=83.83 TRINITY_DN4402_c0_g1_i8:842-2200(-)